MKNKKYTALVIALNDNETFTLSREVNTLGKRTIYNFLKETAKVEDDAMDTILVFVNGKDSPEVARFWRAANGDFEGL